MFTRWLTGLFVSSLALVLAWAGSYYWLGFVIFLLSVAAAEWGSLAGTESLFVPITIVAACFLFIGASFEYVPVLLLLPLLPVIYQQDPELIKNVVWAAAGIVWLSIPAVLLYELRIEYGFLLLIALLVGTWMQDSLALYAGLWFGGDGRMAPGLSPNKTWEGFFGGLFGMVITFLLTAYWFGWPIWGGLLIGVLLGFVGQAGDLSVSALKRRIDRDDTGILFPGHGGILDRVDALVVNVAVFYPLCQLMEYLS